MGTKVRILVAGLTLSAGALVGIAQREDYREKAYLPTPNDVPTVGFGSTEGVRMGDRITPVRALIRLNQEVDHYQTKLRGCIGDVALYQHEWDAYVSLTYNIGIGAACGSTLVKKLRQQPPDYRGACLEILRWDRQAGKQLRGLTARRQAEYRTCMGGT
jgi:lysozyme